MSKTKELSQDSHSGPLVCRDCDSATPVQDEPPFLEIRSPDSSKGSPADGF